MDWNWFFSSLSQSAAAIVGIFGAFIITKILSNQATFSEKNNRCKETLTSCKRVLDAADGLYFEWYNKHTNNRQYEKLEEMIENEDYLPSAHYFDELNFSNFSPRNEIINEIDSRINKHKAVKEREREEFRKRAAAYQKIKPGFAYVEPAPMKIPKFPSSSMELLNNLQKEREAIDSVVRDAKHHMRLASNMLDSIKGNPESSPQITYTLALVAALFFIGVIYPLSFMPTKVDSAPSLSFLAFFPLLFSIKGAFLSLLSIIFCSVLVMFFWLNSKLKYSGNTINDLDHYKNIESYSQYFSIMKENEILGAANHDG